MGLARRGGTRREGTGLGLHAPDLSSRKRLTEGGYSLAGFESGRQPVEIRAGGCADRTKPGGFPAAAGLEPRQASNLSIPGPVKATAHG